MAQTASPEVTVEQEKPAGGKASEKVSGKDSKKTSGKDSKKDSKKKKKDGEDEKAAKKLKNKKYLKELARLHMELVKMQEWIRTEKVKVVVVFEGRDAAGKGGVIKTIAEGMNPRICRVVALSQPTERQRTQWYYQRYVEQLPAGGEMVLFDRSWYNRAGVERVMGFCTDEEYHEFLRSCPEIERMFIRSGFILIKYWFSVSDQEQEKRFQQRLERPAKRWKLSPMDLESRGRWDEFSKAKDDMFAHTDTKHSPWFVVNADNKKAARLNCIHHLLSLIPYVDLTPKPMKLPPRRKNSRYERPPMSDQTFVPPVYG